MHRCMRWAIGLGCLLSLTAREAGAQWAYGGWGWLGWDTSVKSDCPGGPAFYALGAGVHNYDPRISHDLVTRYNDYVSDTVLTHRFLAPGAFQAAHVKRSRDLYEQHIARLRQEPNAAQIEDGSA